MLLGFQPTYEELKPSIGQVPILPSVEFSAYLRGIETSVPAALFYLKLPFSAYLRGIETQRYACKYIFVLGFQPTYEELKLSNPIRERYTGIKFSAYLRGIETFVCL